jgi:hypothetical protein
VVQRRVSLRSSEGKARRSAVHSPHLLRHDVFTRMRDLQNRRREMDAELRGLDGRLSALANATDEALTANELTLAGARERRARAATARDNTDQEVQDARRRRKLTQDVEHLQSARFLERETPNIDGLRIELEQARRASAIVPRLEAFRAAIQSRNVPSGSNQQGAAAERSTTAKRQPTAPRCIGSRKKCDALSARFELHGNCGRRSSTWTVDRRPKGGGDARLRGGISKSCSRRTSAGASEGPESRSASENCRSLWKTPMSMTPCWTPSRPRRRRWSGRVILEHVASLSRSCSL